MTVLLFTWHAFVTNSATGRYFIFMNVVVHLFMYTYYALTAIGIRPPTRVSMLITTLQILQMAGGIYILSRARAEHQAGNYCQVPQSVITSGFLMYSSYLALFVHFFLQAYVFGKKNILNSKKCCQSASPVTTTIIRKEDVGKGTDLNANYTLVQNRLCG